MKRSKRIWKWWYGIQAGIRRWLINKSTHEIFQSNFRRQGIVHLFTRTDLTLCSAVEARRKTPSSPLLTSDGPNWGWLSHHEPEDTGSKPVGGILVLAKLIAWCRHLPGVAQRQRARLITARSYDRNVSPGSVLIELVALYWQNSGSKDIGGSKTRTWV